MKPTPEFQAASKALKVNGRPIGISICKMLWPIEAPLPRHLWIGSNGKPHPAACGSRTDIKLPGRHGDYLIYAIQYPLAAYPQHKDQDKDQQREGRDEPKGPPIHGFILSLRVGRVIRENEYVRSNPPTFSANQVQEAKPGAPRNQAAESMKYALRITPAANADVDQAATYIAEDSLESALRFYDAIELTFRELRKHPERWPVFSCQTLSLQNCGNALLLHFTAISSFTASTGASSK